MTVTPGAIMGAAIELVLQEALVNGLAVLASDNFALEEVVARRDALRHNSSEKWRKSMKAALIEMADPSSDMHADVIIGYPVPQGTAKLPALSIVVSTGGENTGEAVTGNSLRRFVEPHGPNNEVWETREVGAGQTTVLEVGAWATAPDRSALLNAAAKWALYQQRQRLLLRGVHEITFREGGVNVAPELDPRVAYLPILSVTLSWTFRQSVRQKVPNRTRLLKGSFSSTG